MGAPASSCCCWCSPSASPGYLLPWDQRADRATVVTINIAKSTPVVGPYIAGIMRGGPAIGALTLSRWYATHVILLPVGVLLFVVTHLYLMRRHGIAGHFRPRVAPSSPFYPVHAVKDTIVIAAVFALLFSLGVYGKAPLEAMANPADATYVPRPEWYFLGLFQMLKYFPGKLEPVGAIGIPTLVIALLFLLPFLDRRPERDPRARPRVSARRHAGHRRREHADVARVPRHAERDGCGEEEPARDRRTGHRERGAMYAVPYARRRRTGSVARPHRAGRSVDHRTRRRSQ